MTSASVKINETNPKFHITAFQDNSEDIYVEGLNTNVRYQKVGSCPCIKPDRSLFLFTKNNRFRRILIFIAQTKVFEWIVLLAIGANCIVMAMGTPNTTDNDTVAFNNKLEQSEIYFIIFFLCECIIKVISFGFVLHPHSYLRDGWNIMDFFIVVIGIVTFILSKVQTTSTIDIKALRVFRVLRPLRLVKKVSSLQIVVSSIISALKPLGHIAILILFLIVIYAIVGMNLFMGKLHATCYNNSTMVMMDNPSTCRVSSTGTGYFCTGLPPLPPRQSWVCVDFPKNDSLRWRGPHKGISNFDNMALAMLTVFQVITKEGWTEIMYSLSLSSGTYQTMSSS